MIVFQIIEVGREPKAPSLPVSLLRNPTQSPFLAQHLAIRIESVGSILVLRYLRFTPVGHSHTEPLELYGAIAKWLRR